MKRLILAAVALTMFAAPAAYADQRPSGRHEFQRSQNHQAPKPGWQNGHVVKKKVVKKTIVKQPRWARGHQVPGWKNHRYVRDHHRYGLKRPGRGQEWIRVGNDYLLISISNGRIVGLFGGR